MSEELVRVRVIQNGNPFEGARIISKDHAILVAFDVGAHVGEVVVHVSSKLPEATIYAFEPHRAAVERLELL